MLAWDVFDFVDLVLSASFIEIEHMNPGFLCTDDVGDLLFHIHFKDCPSIFGMISYDSGLHGATEFYRIMICL